MVSDRCNCHLWPGIIGFSSFLITDRTVGHTNKLNFLGRFGGFLDSFSWLKEKLFQKNLLKRELRQFSESFDIDRLFILRTPLTMDGVGEWATTSAAVL